MLQTTTTFENFTITSTGEKRQSLDFAPKPTFRLGGYFGWRWLFLGYTFDVGSLLGRESSSKRKTEFDLSFYTSRLGIDVYFRKTGNDFRCKNLNQIFSPENPRPADLSDDFEGLNIQTRGFNLYYIFNYRHFSWPAAFAQNTVQRRSCGTFKLGFSFTHHKVTLDPSKLDARIEPLIDPSMYFDEIKYNDYGINFGYAYNWVPRRNWLLCASFTPQLAYNVVYVDREEARHNIAEAELNRFLNFRDNRFSIDFILRLGLVYNDTKWYAGASFILHSTTTTTSRCASTTPSVRSTSTSVSISSGRSRSEPPLPFSYGKEKRCRRGHLQRGCRQRHLHQRKISETRCRAAFQRFLCSEKGT